MRRMEISESRLVLLMRLIVTRSSHVERYLVVGRWCGVFRHCQLIKSYNAKRTSAFLIESVYLSLDDTNPSTARLHGLHQGPHRFIKLNCLQLKSARQNKNNISIHRITDESHVHLASVYAQMCFCFLLKSGASQESKEFLIIKFWFIQKTSINW